MKKHPNSISLYHTPKVMMAPMEGVIDFTLRKILSAIGGFDLFVTEFIRVSQTELPDSVFFKYAPELKSGGRTSTGVPVYVQLLGSHPELLTLNALRAVQLGALGIDMNFGCPARSVNHHDGGASLLKTPDRIFNILKTMRLSLPDSIPLTAKIRLGYENKDLFLDIAHAVEQAQCHHIVVHGRTKKEGYRPPAHWEFIGRIKQSVKIPVIANGEIWSLADYNQCISESNCDFVALGRGAFAHPYLALEIQKRTLTSPHENKNPAAYEQELLIKWIPFFIDELISLQGEAFALARLKQWTKHLGRNYPLFQNLFEKIKVLKKWDPLHLNSIQHTINQITFNSF